jgi:hypothetical protein
MQGVYSNETFFKTPEHAILSLNSVYNICAFNNTKNCLWVFGDVASDDAIKGGNPGDQSEIEFIDQFSHTRDNGYINNIWQWYYEGIARANDVITYVPNITMDENQKTRIIAEAKFLRAYFYFNLTNIFGEIPLKTKAASKPEDLQVGKSSVADIYAQIYKDLDFASKTLPEKQSAQDLGRATKGAAYALLAKAYLYNEEWEKTTDVIAEFEKIPGYKLLENYSNNFKESFDNNSESVFEIQHLSEQEVFLGSFLNQWFSPAVENGYGFNIPTQSLVDAYEILNDTICDPRLDYTIGRENHEWINGNQFDPSWSATGFMQKKHIQPLSIVSKGTKGDAGLNYTYIRLADIILMKAEALNEQDEFENAIKELNKIRKRARECFLHDSNLKGYGTVPTNLLTDRSSTNKNTIRQYIREERRVELAFEFHRYFDLMRYGKIEAENKLGNKFDYQKNRYFPIPQSEIDINSQINN